MLRKIVNNFIGFSDTATSPGRLFCFSFGDGGGIDSFGCTTESRSALALLARLPVVLILFISASEPFVIAYNI